MSFSITLYAVTNIKDAKWEVDEIVTLSGKTGLLLVNWFYTFYHKQNLNYLEESLDFVMFYIDEIVTLHEHLIQAMEGQTHLMPVYPLTYDNIFYIEPESKEYYRIVTQLYDCIHNLFYEQNTFNDGIFFYRASW